MPELSQQLRISSFGITKATCKQTQQLPTSLGAIASVLTVVYKRMQQHKTLESVCNARTWPRQCWESCATDRTLLRYPSAITEQRKCWQLLTQKFEQVSNFEQQLSTTHSNMQQAGASNSVGSCWPTKLRPIPQGFK